MRSLEIAHIETDKTSNDTTVLMPIGGRATRARSVTGDAIPKHLIPMGDKTVLDVVCQGLQTAGFRDFVFCVGHHSDQIRKHLSEENWITTDRVNYSFSQEVVPLGVDGAILHAIGNLGLQGRGLIVPGDVMLPWQGVASMDKRHATWGSDITVGVTSYVTERTTDVGKIIVEDDSDRILWCYSREETNDTHLSGSQALTSAAATSISMEGYADICNIYLADTPEHGGAPLSFRDHVIPWASRTGAFPIRAYDIQGEVLDLGTPANIYYGQDNWQNYV